MHLDELISVLPIMGKGFAGIFISMGAIIIIIAILGKILSNSNEK